MKNKWSCRLRRAPATSFALLLIAMFFVSAAPVAADAPEWLRAAARTTLPTYPPDTDAVMLLDERITTVKDSGEIKTTYRFAYKILRPAGREHGKISIPFDNETRITFLKAWCIPAQGKEYEVKEKDAVEIGSMDDLYNDNRVKAITIPAADPGNVIGWEYEQKRRPFVLQDKWLFQDPHPVKQARFTLQLPSGWEYQMVWMNHPKQEPRSVGENTWVWEVQDVAAIEMQPAMPAWNSIAGWMAVSYFPPGANLASKKLANWQDVGAWYHGLSSGRRDSTPEIKAKVAELTAGKSSFLDKLRVLGAFAQRDIRYVSIQIGIGGYQPHAARDIFANRYGDCKDKVTLLSSMLKELGVDSYYLLVHTNRGVVAREFASALNFNHVILAIKLPDGTPTDSLFAMYIHPQLGKLLLFDPTDELTPVGHLPAHLQQNNGLLVFDGNGELIEMPLQAPATNQLLRTAKLELSPTGTLSGEVHEVRLGPSARDRRGAFLSAEGSKRARVVEDFLASFLPGFVLTFAAVENLESYDEQLVLRYRFTAENYAKRAGNLLLLRPRVLGQKASGILEDKKERKYAYEFDSATFHKDVFEIRLPAGYKADELPPPVQVDSGFAEYRSAVKLEGNVLRYERDYQIKQVTVPLSKMDELKKFYRTVAADERSNAVLQPGQ